ncbi:hypothetical protein [Lewinella sp. W8]|uniref:hypothetical protein n=1 Tax=Lewinella sp. W8 TaxID=2528208 RepID=UPI0010681379|nr:hypothetical protein [Lewinella sp. W8]MTB51241.1 hypothetical protein [Lewinella sp. W8]
MKFYRKGFLTLALLCWAGMGGIRAQLIFPESFIVLMDSSRQFRGTFSPEIKIQTQKDLLVEVSSLADVALRIKENSLVLAHKLEFTSVGGNVALSGGYFFSKFKSRKGHRWMPESYAQLQWANARGLELGYGVGANLRYALRLQQRSGLYVGAGVFYEYEKWTYRGVRDELLPVDRTPILTRAVKFNLYGSWKQWFGDQYFLDLSVYHQARFDELLSGARLGSSTAFSWQISQYLRLGARYQNIYDPDPVVPIRNWFHRFVTAFTVTL